jgi:CubicO group peptidase (beta-lactamase class C family)
MTPLTLVHVGSLTKLFTALAVTAALEQRGISQKTPVGQFMPGLNSRAAATTFHHLLSHTAGLRDRPGDTGTDDELALASSARALTAEDFPLAQDVVFSYSNLGYALAGATLESLSKVGFAEALRDAALRPVGMERSTVRPSEALARPHALGHRLKGTATETLRTPSNDTRIWPAGYLWTNAVDMSRVLTALMNKGHVPDHAGLPPTVVERVAQPHVPMPNVFVGGHYGYGLMSTRDRGVMIYEHGGTLPGFSSILRFAPERRLGVAILTNLDNAPLRRIAQNVMAQALDLPPPPPNSRSERAVTVDEMKPFVGRYVNRGTAELAVRDGSVVLILDEGPPFAVTRIGEDRFLARPKPDVPGPEFVLRPATRESPAYLHLALWAYVRQ